MLYEQYFQLCLSHLPNVCPNQKVSTRLPFGLHGCLLKDTPGDGCLLKDTPGDQEFEIGRPMENPKLLRFKAQSYMEVKGTMYMIVAGSFNVYFLMIHTYRQAIRI